MKVRILTEQEPRRDNADRGYLASGSEVDLDKAWALELLSRGEAEPVAEKTAQRAEKRPSTAKNESR